MQLLWLDRSLEEYEGLGFQHRVIDSFEVAHMYHANETGTIQPVASDLTRLPITAMVPYGCG